MDANNIGALVNGIITGLLGLGALGTWIGTRGRADRKKLRRLEDVVEQAIGYGHRLRLRLTERGDDALPEWPPAVQAYRDGQE